MNWLRFEARLLAAIHGITQDRLSIPRPDGDFWQLDHWSTGSCLAMEGFRIMKTVIITLLALGLTTPVLAETPKEAAMKLAKPGAGHAALASLVGKWETVTRAFMSKKPDGKAVEFKGHVEKSWVLGGRFLHEAFAGTGPDGKPYSGIGYLGYDNGGKRYQGLWMSGYGTAMVLYTGSVDASGKVFTFAGKEKDPTGQTKELAFKMVLRIKSADEHSLTQYYEMPGKGEVKAFEIVHTRKK